MKKREILIIIIVFLVVIIPILFNELKRKKINDLKKEVNNVIEILSIFNKDLDKTIQYDISNKLVVNDNIYKIKGTGVAFADNDDIIVMLSKGDICVAKVPVSKNLVVAETECPRYELIKGIKSKIVNSGDGLYKVDNDYFYRGSNVNNYLLFNNSLWRILAISDKGIKIIMDNSILSTKWDSYLMVYDHLEKYFYDNLNDKKNIISYVYRIGTFSLSSVLTFDDIMRLEDSKNLDSKVGLLTFSDYINSCTSYEIGNDNILCDNSYLNKPMWIGNSYYLYKDNNIYKDKVNTERDIYPVLFLDVEIIGGSGTSSDPYIYN